MPDVNKGIINYGSIGGSATVNSGDVHFGDEITVDATKSNIAIKSTLEGATQGIHALPTADTGLKNDLERLLSQLSEALAKVPAEHAEQAEAIAEQVREALAVAERKSSDRTVLQAACDGLKTAAATLTVVAPPVVAIAKDIVGIIAEVAAL